MLEHALSYRIGNPLYLPRRLGGIGGLRVIIHRLDPRP
jgi:hypothetical protein